MNLFTIIVIGIIIIWIIISIRYIYKNRDAGCFRILQEKLIWADISN